MENPRTINRFLLATFAVSSAACAAASVCFHSIFILLGWLGAVVAFFVLCGLFALFNIVVFAPLFRLLAKLDARMRSSESRDG